VKAEPAPPRYTEYRRRVAAGLRAADALVAPTNAFRDQFLDEHGFSGAMEVIANARDSSWFRPGKKTTRILSAGRLWDEGKNLRLLDRIASQAESEIAVAGDAQLENVSPFAGRRLHWLGKLDERSLARELAQSAVYAAPALYEPFGLAILEAALSGCALVLSDLPSLRENWDGCARFVPPNDDAAWIAALNELTSNAPEEISLQTQARARALRMNPAAQASAYLQVYREVAAPRFAPVSATAFL
jgi:glycogen synthase